MLIILIISAGISIHAGGFMSRDTILNTRDGYYNALNLADLEMEFTPLSEEEMPDMSELGDSASLLKRLVMPGIIETKKGELLQALVIYIDPESMPEINRLKITGGNFLNDSDNNLVVIERTLAEVHGYSVGDRITLNPYSFPQELTVGGIAISPEFVISTSDPTVLIPSKGSLGVIFASKNLIEEIFGYPLYNQLLFKLKNGTNTGEIKNKVKEKFKEFEIIRFVSREEQFSYRFLKEDMKGFGIFIPSIVLVFAIIISIIIIVTMNRLILSQSREIGVLLAHGYRRSQIFTSYLTTGLLFGISGFFISIPGSIIIRNLFTGTYRKIMGLPPLFYTFSFNYVLGGAGIFLLVTILATSVPLYRTLRVIPQELLRGEKEEKFMHLPQWLTQITLYFSRNSVPRLFGIRNILRRPKLATATIIIIASAIALSTSFLVSASSWENFARVSFAREKWDAIITFRTHLEESDLKEIMNIPRIAKYEPLVGGYGAVKVGEKEYDYMIVGIDPGSKVRHFNIEKGKPLSGENEYEILLNTAWSDLPRINPGEFVSITTKKGTYRFKVAGLIADMTLGTAYIPLNVARTILDLDKKTSAVLAVFNITDHEEVRKSLFNHEMVTRVELKKNMETLVNSYMEQMKKLSYIALSVSIFIGVLFLLSSITMNIQERSGEYATLQTLGYYNREIAVTVVTEILAEGIIAVLISIPLTIIFSKYLNIKMSQAWINLDMYLNVWDFLSVIISSLFFLPLAGLPGLIQIFKQDVAVTVRRKSFG